MRIYDITQELFSCEVYPGDTVPTMNPVMRISDGAPCNLTDMNICVHNGTHIDAPYHFFADGKTIDEIDLTKCIGKAVVKEYNGSLTKDAASELISGDYQRVLIKGNTQISPEAAEVIAKSGIFLLGVESQSVSDSDTAAEVHKTLLDAEIVLLEGIVLKDVPCGEYMLSALPLKLGGTDGSPCRAVLFSDRQ